jgi:hypothetical protein
MSELLSEDEHSSLTEDAVDIPQNLNWINFDKGKNFFRKVLSTFDVQESEAIESNAARIILSQIDNKNTVNTERDDFERDISSFFSLLYKR